MTPASEEVYFAWTCPLCGAKGLLNSDDMALVADAAMRLDHCRKSPECTNALGFGPPRENDLKVFRNGVEINLLS